jgi:hypothetical protein
MCFFCQVYVHDGTSSVDQYMDESAASSGIETGREDKEDSRGP